MPEFDNKLVLAAYRPNGSDAGDPLIDAAVRAAAEDPELGSHFARARAFDTCLAESIATIPVPSDLREKILAGTRPAASPASAAPRATSRIRRATAILASAACIGLAAVVAPIILSDHDVDMEVVASSSLPQWQKNAFALLDGIVSKTEAFDVNRPAADEARSWFAAITGRTDTIPAALADRPAIGCKHMSGPEGSLALMCFQTESGAIVHLSVWMPPAGDEALEDDPLAPQFVSTGKWDSAAWVGDDGLHYMLATFGDEESEERLRKFVPGLVS